MWDVEELMMLMVHLVLHPHGIAPTFLKLDSWSLGAGFIPIISNKGINLIKKKFKFYAHKKISYILKRWMQFRVGAIPRLPMLIIVFLRRAIDTPITPMINGKYGSIG